MLCMLLQFSARVHTPMTHCTLHNAELSCEIRMMRTFAIALVRRAIDACDLQAFIGIVDATGTDISQKTNLSIAFLLTEVRPSILRHVQIQSDDNVDLQRRRGTHASDVSGPDTAHAYPDGSRHGGLPGIVQSFRRRRRFARKQRAASESRRSGFLRR